MTPSEGRTAEEVAREIVREWGAWGLSIFVKDWRCLGYGELAECIASALRSRDERIAEYERRSELNPLSGYSCNGVNVWGDETSMKAVRSAFHEAVFQKQSADELRQRLIETEARLSALEAGLKGLVDAVANMRVPQNTAEAALQVSVTIGPAFERARALTEGNKP